MKIEEGLLSRKRILKTRLKKKKHKTAAAKGTIKKEISIKNVITEPKAVLYLRKLRRNASSTLGQLVLYEKACLKYVNECKDN